MFLKVTRRIDVDVRIVVERQPLVVGVQVHESSRTGERDDGS